MAEKAKKDSFLKTSLAELILLLHMAFGGGDGKTSSGKEGTWSRFIKTKLHFLTTEDEVIESNFVAKNLSSEEKITYRNLKKTLDKKGYDAGFLRVHLANRIKNDTDAAKEIVKDILGVDEWKFQKVILQEYYLLKKKSVFLIAWENRGWILYTFVILVILLLAKINYSMN